MKKLNTSKMSDEELQDLFTDSYLDQVGNPNDISEIECKCQRKNGSDEITMEITVAGLAGTPCFDEYKSADLDDTDRVVIERENLQDEMETLAFEHDAEEDYVLNTNDYVVVYKSV